jgi:glutamine synthetase
MRYLYGERRAGDGRPQGGSMTDGREYLEAKVLEDDIEFFFAMFVDMHGKPCAKLVPASAMDVLMEGAGSPGSRLDRCGRHQPTPT